MESRTEAPWPSLRHIPPPMMVNGTAQRSTPDDVTGADEQRPSYVIDSANTTVATQIPPR